MERVKEKHVMKILLMTRGMHQFKTIITTIISLQKILPLKFAGAPKYAHSHWETQLT